MTILLVCRTKLFKMFMEASMCLNNVDFRFWNNIFNSSLVEFFPFGQIFASDMACNCHIYTKQVAPQLLNMIMMNSLILWFFVNIHSVNYTYLSECDFLNTVFYVWLICISVCLNPNMYLLHIHLQISHIRAQIHGFGALSWCHLINCHCQTLTSGHSAQILPKGDSFESDGISET